MMTTSSVFQVSEKKINPSKWITEKDYQESDFRFIADSVESVNLRDRAELISDLFRHCDGITVNRDDSGDYFLQIKDKEDYFFGQFKLWKKSLKELMKLNLDDFTAPDGKLRSEMKRLNTKYSDSYGCYIQSDNSFTTLNDFVRNAKPDKKYYIGGAVTYNC